MLAPPFSIMSMMVAASAFTLCGAKSSPPRTSYLGNIKTDNGMIHMINEVIYPGWTLSSGGVGAVGATRDA